MKPLTGQIIWLLLIPVLLSLFSAHSRAQSAERIVSLDLCTDWMLLKYASQSLSITYSPLLYRYRQGWVPEGLPVHNGSLEQILQLNPELIISGEFNATLLTKRLKQLGKNTVIMPLPLTLQSIIKYTQQFKSLVPTNQLLDKQLVIRNFESNGNKLLLLGANGIGAGQGTLEHDIIIKSGWSNYLDLAGFVSLDLEQIVMNPPDAVLWSRPVSNSLANLFANHRVLNGVINQQQTRVSDYWRWQCPGPWTFELISELATWKKR